MIFGEVTLECANIINIGSRQEETFPFGIYNVDDLNLSIPSLQIAVVLTSFNIFPAEFKVIYIAVLQFFFQQQPCEIGCNDEEWIEYESGSCCFQISNLITTVYHTGSLLHNVTEASLYSFICLQSHSAKQLWVA